MRKVQIHAFVLAGVCLLWFGVQASLKPAQGAGRVLEDFKSIPLDLKGWSGTVSPLDKVTLDALPNSALMNRYYASDGGYDTNVTIVYGVDLGGFHQPEYCMEGSGWRRMTSKTVTVHAPEPHQATVLTMTNDYNQVVVVYWFATDGSISTNLGRQKSLALFDRLKRGKTKTTAMIRLITPLAGDEASAEKATLDLAAAIDPHINRMLAVPPRFEAAGAGLEE